MVVCTYGEVTPIGYLPHRLQSVDQAIRRLKEMFFVSSRKPYRRESSWRSSTPHLLLRGSNWKGLDNEAHFCWSRQFFT